MGNQFHERLFEALDFNEENVSERIFVVEDKKQGERMICDLSQSAGKQLRVTVVTPFELCHIMCLEESRYQDDILIHISHAIEMITDILLQRADSYHKYSAEDIHQLAVRYYHQFASCEHTHMYGDDMNEDEWNECQYIHCLYRDRKREHGVYDKADMVGAALFTMWHLNKWQRQHFVFLENFRYFGMEMRLIDRIPRGCVTVVLQPDDKELNHLEFTNTYFKRAISMRDEVAEVFDSISRNHRNPEECAIIYMEEESIFLLAQMAAKKQVPLNHIGIPYDILNLIEHLKQVKRSLEMGTHIDLQPGIYELPEELDDVTASIEKQSAALIQVLYCIQEHLGYTMIVQVYNPIYKKLVEIFVDMEDEKIFENKTVLDVFIERMEQMKSLEGGEGILVMPIESAQFTGRKYLYVIGLNDRKLPVYDPCSKEILENPEEVEEAYQGGYAREVIPIAKLLDVLGNHEGVTYFSYALFDDFQRYTDVLLPAPFYSMLKSKISLAYHLERWKNSTGNDL